MADNAREEMLGGIRAANGGSTTMAAAAQAWDGIARGYKQAGTLPRAEMLTLLGDRLRDYDAVVECVTSNGVAAAIEGAIAGLGGGRMLVAAGFPEELLPRGAGFTSDAGFSHAELDGFAGVLTTATLAIAETGTLVLQNVPGQGRRVATLVPDVHLCVVRAKDVVATVPEALDRLAHRATLPTTFVSGPSATADIEMTRIKGVHGPRFLHVLIVGEQV